MGPEAPADGSSSKPVAMTVTRASSPWFSSMTAPKMRLASSWAVFLDQRGGLVDLVQGEVGAAGDVDQDAVAPEMETSSSSGELDRALGGVDASRAHPLAVPTPMSARPCCS
jgi:hypothetical protein